MYDDGVITLRECIEAEYHHRLLVEEYEQERDKVFTGIYPSYDNRYGWLTQESISTENAVIYIMEAEERIKEEMEPLYKKRSLLNKALETLTPFELDVYNHIVWGDSLKSYVDGSLLNSMSEKVNQKLCNYLSSKCSA